MANTHSLIVRLPATVVDARLRGELDLGEDQLAVGGPPTIVPWIGDLEACRRVGTWTRGRRIRRATIDVVPVNDWSALITFTGWGRGIDTATIVELAERLRHRLTTGPFRPSTDTAPAAVVRPVRVATTP